MSEKLVMKNLIPDGGGAWSVHEFVKNTEEGVKVLRETLEAAGDWAVATDEDLSNWISAREAVAGVLNNEEWVKVESLSEEQKTLIRGAVAGEWMLAKSSDDSE